MAINKTVKSSGASALKQIKSINQARVALGINADETPHNNFMGGTSFDLKNPLVQLRIAAASSFFGEPTYYGGKDFKRKAGVTTKFESKLRGTLGGHVPAAWASLGPAERMEAAIDAALAYSVKDTLEIAVALRNEDNIRTTPQVIIVRAAQHAAARGTGLVREYMQKIARRTDDVVTQFAYQMETFGKSVPNSLKKGWKAYLEDQSELSLAKYRMENRQHKLVDVVYFAHAKTDAIGKLMNGSLTLGDDQTWEAMTSAQGSNTETWTKAIDVMGHMALLRNLNNFVKHSVPTKAFLPKLVETAPKGKQLPFRYYSAYNAVGASAPAVVKDAIETCLELSMDNLPMFKGRTMSLCDNSGSAQGAFTSTLGTVRVSQIANLTAVLTAKRSDEGFVGVFGDKLSVFDVKKKASVFEQVAHADKLGANIGGSTENGIWLFWDKAIQNKEHWDHVFVYSDMQAGHGGLYGVNPQDYKAYQWNDSQFIDVPMLIAKYRAEVNPDVQVYLVQVAGYQDSLVPEHYNKTHVLGGWGDGILRFAAKMAELEGSTPTVSNKTQTQPVVSTGTNAAQSVTPAAVRKAKALAKKSSKNITLGELASDALDSMGM